MGASVVKHAATSFLVVGSFASVDMYGGGGSSSSRSSALPGRYMLSELDPDINAAGLPGLHNNYTANTSTPFHNYSLEATVDPPLQASVSTDRSKVRASNSEISKLASFHNSSNYNRGSGSGSGGSFGAAGQKKEGAPDRVEGGRDTPATGGRHWVHHELSHPQCGLAGETGIFEVPSSSQLHNSSGSRQCSRLAMANCTSTSDKLGLCPRECPFLDRTAYSKCGIACVAAAECGRLRRAFPYANNASWQCEPCHASLGCAKCVEQQVEDAPVLQCTKCYDGFYLSNGACVYGSDFVWGTTYMVTGITMAILLLIVVFLLCYCNRNAELTSRGCEHRNRCLPHQVETAPCTSGHSLEAEVIYHSRSPLYPLTVDVHGQNIVGVGLALYYNHLVFVAVFALLCWAVLYFADAFLGLPLWSVTDCTFPSETDMQHMMTTYFYKRSLTALMCWGAALPASVIFARFQAAAARTFDSVHTLMEDYALMIRGLPESATDPIEIQDFIERLLGSSIEGVSIAYDFRHVTEEVRTLLDEHLAARDTGFEAALGVPRARYRARPKKNMPALNEEEEMLTEQSSIDWGELGHDQAQARELLSSIKGSGEAFVVLKREEDVEKLFHLWDLPLLQRTGSFLSFEATLSSPARRMLNGEGEDFRLFRGLHELELREVTSEPTSIMWHHMGRSDATLIRRGVLGVTIFLVFAMLVNLALYRPYFQFVSQYAQRAGQPPTSLQTCGLGIIVSLGSSLIANVIWAGVPRLGFVRKDQADIVTFIVRWVVVLLNTVMVVLITGVKLSAIGAVTSKSLDPVLHQSEELGREAALSQQIVVLFLTGSFSVSYIFFWLSYPMAYWQGIFPIRTGLLGQRLPVRVSERLLEPMEIWLPWDYASHIQLTCSAFVPLFLADPPEGCSTSRMCMALVLWCFVMYCAQRLVHLRFSKETFFTTGRLDRVVLYAWAAPVSQLAMAAAWWLSRAWQLTLSWKLALCCGTFCASWVIYCSFLYRALEQRKVIAMMQKKKEPYNQALARLRYSYFNTNPIHVLLSDHFPERGLKPTTFYEAGKAYLQAADPRVHARLEAMQMAAETAPGSDRRILGGRSSFPGQNLLYHAQVWLTGVPRSAFQSLDGSDLDGNGMLPTRS